MMPFQWAIAHSCHFNFFKQCGISIDVYCRCYKPRMCHRPKCPMLTTQTVSKLCLTGIVTSVCTCCTVKDLTVVFVMGHALRLHRYPCRGPWHTEPVLNVPGVFFGSQQSPGCHRLPVICWVFILAWKTVSTWKHENHSPHEKTVILV